jgi:leader peptidase (prepilin peptidase)/N-methyltransferase
VIAGLPDSGTLVIAGFASLSGLAIGSFIAVLTLRWPAGGAIAGGARSRCDHCDTPLAARDLVPVLSFLWLRGRCRHCGAAIARRHLWIELAAGGIGALSLGLYPDTAGAAGALFGWALLALAILDVEHFWLPDRLTLPLAGFGLAAGFWLAPGLADRAIGAAIGFATLALVAALYRSATGREGMGGGDPRLMGAIGAWLGWAALPFVLLLAASLGLALAGIDRMRGRPVDRTTPLPLGALLAVTAWPLWLAGLPGLLGP